MMLSQIVLLGILAELIRFVYSTPIKSIEHEVPNTMLWTLKENKVFEGKVVRLKLFD